MENGLIQEILKFVGAVATAVVVALFAINKEVKKVKQELERDYSKNLFDKRIEKYSELHYLISKFLKCLRYSSPSVGDIEKFIKEFDDLDSKYSFLFVESTSHYAWYLQRYLHLLLKKGDALSANQCVPDLIDFVAYFEYILRAELGTFDKEVAGVYPDITEKLDKLKEIVRDDGVN